MKRGPSGSFGAQLKALREAAGYTQEELATIAGLSVHAVDSLTNDIDRVLGRA
jgi:transcriptional regulator with XRE-family HTH domain